MSFFHKNCTKPKPQKVKKIPTTPDPTKPNSWVTRVQPCFQL